MSILSAVEKLMDDIFDHLYKNSSSWQFRGRRDVMEYEIYQTIVADPFPCIDVRIYPNGKGKESLGESMTSSPYDEAYKEKIGNPHFTDGNN